MRNQYALQSYQNSIGMKLAGFRPSLPRKAMIGVILMVALLAFEIFNFDTTRYALRNLMGDVQFLGFQWAAILAIAFCSIDFAGLVRLFTPEKGRDEPKEVWYLTGAWLLGATMNALMTWWAVSLTLLNHDFGNEVLSREQLLDIVPFFVAVLVWLTRILFIGAFSVAGEHIFDLSGKGSPKRTVTSSARAASSKSSQRPTAAPAPKLASRRNRQPVAAPPAYAQATKVEDKIETPTRTVHSRDVQPTPTPVRPASQGSNRIHRRPPMPNGSGVRRVSYGGVQAKSRTRN